MRFAFGLVFALIAGACFSLSYLGQHHVASKLEDFDLCHPVVGLRQLTSDVRWFVAWASGWVGWGFYVAGLALAPLSLVQAIVAGGIGMLALAIHFFVRPLLMRERRAAYIATAGLVLISVTIRSNGPSHAASLRELIVTVGAGLVLAAVCLLVARNIGPALASGICYGVGDVATKGLFTGKALLALFMAISYVAGFATLQLAFQRSSLLVSGGLSFLLSNAIPFACGIALFGERAPSATYAILRYVGFFVVMVGAVALSVSGDIAEPPANAVLAED